ncbi:MAG: cytochrome P450 [Acidimicrobiales bacterium]|jgi:cytochrome P450|nr:cytochrome P450 [Acidimicrobiales bacterium]MDP6299369.1 cytochrome P450 [Acidimicrobiales bacterium]HJM28217.1 cytochrome P450 [Acidimicrobiales bacterium]HJM98395.1 cytochrome P450 [Acidimicrobiales bacterium]
MTEIIITNPDDAREVYRHKQLRQALYDAGEVVMEDVLVNLHSDEHRQRRRLENRLFRRETFYEYERELFPEIIQETVDPYLVEGKAELVDFGHQLMMNLAAKTAGVDRPQGTYEETNRLYDYMTTFIEGATLAFFTGDVEAKKAEIQEKLEAFDREFLEPGIAMREGLLKEFEAGEITEEELPRDVLLVLLRNQDKIPMTRESLRREIAFYLLAGAHTSATALTRVIHNIFKWLESHPEDESKAYNDKVFLQRATHETIRLQPSSPTAARWALEDIELSSGVKISEGDKVVIDLETVNRNKSLFGDDAEKFNPNRELPEGVSPWGLSFGHGMHACIGQDLAAGLVFDIDSTEEEHLFGLVPVAVQTLFLNGCSPDLSNPPEMDDSTTRPYFGKYPVVFKREIEIRKSS